MRRTSSSFCLIRAFISKAPKSIPLSFFSFSILYISSISCCFALKLSRSYSISSSFFTIARFSSWIRSRKLLSYWWCSFIFEDLFLVPDMIGALTFDRMFFILVFLQKNDVVVAQALYFLILIYACTWPHKDLWILDKLKDGKLIKYKLLALKQMDKEILF